MTTTLLSLAARNLLRNTRRTLLTVAAIAFGLAMMVFAITFASGSYDQMTRKGVSQLAGHVVVQAIGWQADHEPTVLVTGSDAIAAELRALFPEATVTQRIQVGGLLTSAASSVGAGLAACEPLEEAKISDLDGKLVEGAWLAAGDTKGIVIGRGMADRLQVGLGDKVVYLGQQKGQAEMQSRLFRVRGIFRTGSPEMDGFVGVVHLDAAREILTADDAANQIAVHLPALKASPAAADQARAAVGREGLEVLDWKSALPELFAVIQVDKQANDVIMSIISIIVGLGVLNTVLMSVLERTREFGVLMAMGMPRGRVAALVVLEGALLGLLGMTVGLACGFVPSWYVVNHGIDLAPYIGAESMDSSGIQIDALIFGAWDVPRLSKYAVGSVVLTILAAAGPAWRVSRLQPVDAMRSH